VGDAAYWQVLGPPLQVSPELHVEPLQQGSPEAPQHAPFAHVPPVEHVDPAVTHLSPPGSQQAALAPSPRHCGAVAQQNCVA
jgi:hypothetical protein